jgi:metal-sulfur cluster biosynthetic enzyme
MNPAELEQAVIEKLSEVIDPETGIDVMRMHLVQDILFDQAGKISYVFRPSSPLCPIAVPLALGIIDAIKEVPGITGQQITVKDYVQSEQLNEILKTIVD